MIRKIASWVNNAILTGVGTFTFVRYFLFEMGVIDIITKVCLMIITIGGAGKIALGWKLPLIDNFPFLKKIFKFIPRTKPEKYLKMIEDEDFSVIFLLLNLIERIGKRMIKILKWIKLNWVTISGFLIFALYSADNTFDLTAKWNLSDEWYYSIVALIFVLVSYAIKGRGLEKLDFIDRFLNLYQEYKNNKAELKARHKQEIKDKKDAKKNAPIINAVVKALEMKENEKPPINKPPQPNQNNQNGMMR